MRVVFLSIVAAVGLALANPTAARAPKPPVVVELFTAQGCAACPKAAAVLNAYAERRGVVALTFPVDYWDYLGWRDTYAQASYTDRQRAYAHRLKIKEIYTPEIIVDGLHEASGLDRGQVSLLVHDEPAERLGAPMITFRRHASKVEVGSGHAPPRGAEVWLIRYDPTDHQVKVKTGDNKGETVSVRNVVRELARLGSWSGRDRVFALPKPGTDGLKTVVLVQGARGGPILAAFRADASA